MGINRVLWSGLALLFFAALPDASHAQRKRRKSERNQPVVQETYVAPVQEEVETVPLAQVIDSIKDLSDATKVPVGLKALFLLPFREDRIPFRDSLVIDSLYSPTIPIDTLRFIDTLGLVRQIELRRDMQTALEMYYGIQYAIDSAATHQIYVEPRFVDTQLSPGLVTDFAQTDTVGSDLVMGPISPRVARQYLLYRKDKSTPVFVPFMQAQPDIEGTVYYGSTVATQMRQKMLSYALSQYRGERVFLVADSDQEEARTSVKEVFEEAFDVPLINDLAIEQLPEFRDSIVDSLIPNWAFLETNQSGLAASVVSILNGINAEPVKSMRLFTTTPSVVYFNDQVNPVHLSNLIFAYPEVYGRPTDTFVQGFKKKFGFNPSITTTRAFDLTLDAIFRVMVKRRKADADSVFVHSKQRYAGSEIDYETADGLSFQNVAYRLKWVRNLNFIDLDSTIAPELFKPWPEIPDTWLADRLLAIEKMRFPERFDEDGKRIEEEESQEDY